MGRLRLREVAVRLLFRCMDDIGELDRILNEENRDIVADEIPVAFLGVELDRKTAHIARKVRRSLVSGYGREPHKHGRFFAGPLKNVGAGDLGQRFMSLKETVSPVAASMDDSFRDPLVIEMEYLFPKMKIFEKRRSAIAGAQRVLVV